MNSDSFAVNRFEYSSRHPFDLFNRLFQTWSNRKRMFNEHEREHEHMFKRKPTKGRKLTLLVNANYILFPNDCVFMS